MKHCLEHNFIPRLVTDVCPGCEAQAQQFRQTVKDDKENRSRTKRCNCRGKQTPSGTPIVFMPTSRIDGLVYSPGVFEQTEVHELSCSVFESIDTSAWLRKTRPDMIFDYAKRLSNDPRARMEWYMSIIVAEYVEINRESTPESLATKTMAIKAILSDILRVVDMKTIDVCALQQMLSSLVESYLAL